MFLKVYNIKYMPTGIYKRTISVSSITREKMSLSRIGRIGGMLGKKHTEETKIKMRGKRNNYPKGVKRGSPSLETIEKIRQGNLGKIGLSGKDSPHWKEDRNSLKKTDRRNDSAYCEWVKEVYKRDSWKCKINNKDCEGRIEAHHILSWREFVELRYVINNGITLCQFHHPHKKKDETKLSPYFQELVNKM